MEFSKRIGDLSHLARRLNQLQVNLARAQRQRDATRVAASSMRHQEENEQLSSAAKHRQQSPWSTLSRCTATQNELLCRRIPIAVSLVERSWWKMNGRQEQRSSQRLEPQRSSINKREGEMRPSPSAPPSPGADILLMSHSPRLFPGSDNDKALTQPFFPLTPASSHHLEAVFLLLQHLHAMEEARRQLLREKKATAEKRCDVAEMKWTNFQKEFGSRLRRHRHHSLRGRRSGNEGLTEEDVGLLEETAKLLKDRRSSTKEDAAMLKKSLLARSLVSARLWRLLLRKPVWLAAVIEHKKAARQAEISTLPSSTASLSRLLMMCLALSRLSMGVLADYVQGGSLSRTAPRFVASIPSRSWRDRRSRGVNAEGVRTLPQSSTATTPDPRAQRVNIPKYAGVGDVNPEHVPPTACIDDHGNEDPLLTMLQEAALQAGSTAAAAPEGGPKEVERFKSPPPKGKRRGRRIRPTFIDWIPPHTAQVSPLAVETVVLHNSVLPELDVASLLRLGCAASILDLCVTLQRLATTLLAVTSRHSTDDKKDETAVSLHNALQGLESVLATLGRQVKHHLVTDSQFGASEVSITVAGAAEGSRGRLRPEEAARIAVQLQSLRLLPVGDKVAATLLAQLLRDIFPELRTRTSRALQEKARQSSLLAFATRPHRMKLQQTHGTQKVERYLLGTIVQQARLQQRQLMSVLREQHISKVHVQALGRLAQTLPLRDLVTLFQLYARHTAHQSVTQAGKVPLEALDSQLTGCLFLAETLLLSGALPSHPNQCSALSLREFAILWDAAALLYPLVRARRQAQRDNAAKASRVVASVESVVWTTFADHVLATLNGSLAQHLEHMERRRQHESMAMRKPADRAATSSDMKGTGVVIQHEALLHDDHITADSVVALATGVLEYAAHDDAIRSSTGAIGSFSALQPVQQSVKLLARLLQEVVLHDRKLWHSMQALPMNHRHDVERQLAECFGTLGLVDAATAHTLNVLGPPEQVHLRN